MTDSLRTVALESAQAGAAVAAAAFRGRLDVERKGGKTDVVTQADRDAQAAVIEEIRTAYPDATIVGEEEGTAETVAEEGLTWLIDPIDGTANFVRELPNWATSVACLEDGDPVVAVNVMPATDDLIVGTPEGVTRNGREARVSEVTDPALALAIPTLWWGPDRRAEYLATLDSLLASVADVRRFGSAQIELSAVAVGAVEGVVSNVRGAPWDTVAGAAMVEWAGGTVTDIHGQPWSHDADGLVATNGACHENVRKAAMAADDVRQ